MLSLSLVVAEYKGGVRIVTVSSQIAVYRNVRYIFGQTH